MDKEELPEDKKDILFGDPFEDHPFITIPEDKEKELHEKGLELDEKMNSHPTTNILRYGIRTVGVKAEWCFAEYYGMDSWEPKVVDGGDDFKVEHLPSGKVFTIDVKGRDFYEADLTIPEDKPLVADVYFLVERRGRSYGFIGWATKQMMLDAPVVKENPVEGLREFPVKTRIVMREDTNPIFDKDSLREL